MRYFAPGSLLALVTFAAYMLGDAVGYRDGKRDVAEHWWDYCRTEWRREGLADSEAVRACNELMPTELGLENTWGFR